jgi:hypothetical protein
MTLCVDRLRPKSVQGLVLIKHDSYHIYESSVLSFGHPILLRSIGDRKLIIDAFFIENVFYLRVLEFGAIVTSNLLDFGIKLVLCHFQELF